MHIQKHKTSCPWYPHQDHQVVMRFSFKGPFLSQCPYSQVDINNKLFIHGKDSLYYQGISNNCVNSIIDLIEFAEETYADDCDSLIIILEKCTKNMGKISLPFIMHRICSAIRPLDSVLRTLLYFGFQLIDPRIYNHTASYVLVGYEL